MSRYNKKRSGGRSSFSSDRTYRKRSLPPIMQQAYRGQYKRNTGGFVLLIALTVVLFFVFLTLAGQRSHMATASGTPLLKSSSNYGSLNQVKGLCGNTSGQATCNVDPGWFSASVPVGFAVSSLQVSTMVATSIIHSSPFTTMQSRYGYVAADAPVLVHAYAAHTGIEYYDLDHWVVSVRNTAGLRVGVFDFVYDSVHQRMRFSSFGVIPTQDPHSRLAFPYMSVNKVTSLLRQQRGLSIVASSQPELIFFPLDPRYRNIASNKYRWTGGGDSPMNPLWYTPSSNKQAYFIGEDSRIYIQKDIPVAVSLK